MATLYGQLELALPAGWEDHSIYTFVAPAPLVGAMPTLSRTAAVRPNLVVARGELGEHDLTSVAQKQLATSAQELTGFRLVEQGPNELAGLPAFSATYTFVAGPESLTVEQRQVFVAQGKSLFTLTLTYLPGDRSQLEPLLAQVRFAQPR